MGSSAFPCCRRPPQGTTAAQASSRLPNCAHPKIGATTKRHHKFLTCCCAGAFTALQLTSYSRLRHSSAGTIITLLLPTSARWAPHTIQLLASSRGGISRRVPSPLPNWPRPPEGATATLAPFITGTSGLAGGDESIGIKGLQLGMRWNGHDPFQQCKT